MLTPSAILLAIVAPLAASYMAAGKAIADFVAKNAAALAFEAAPAVCWILVVGVEWQTGDTFERFRVAALAVTTTVLTLKVAGKLPTIVPASK